MSVIKGQDVVVRILGQFLPEFSQLVPSSYEAVWQLAGESNATSLTELMILRGYLNRTGSSNTPVTTGLGRQIFDSAKPRFAFEIDLAQVLTDMPVGLDPETVQSLKNGTYEGD